MTTKQEKHQSALGSDALSDTFGLLMPIAGFFACKIKLVVLELEENCCCSLKGFSAAYIWQALLWQVNHLRLTPIFTAYAKILSWKLLKRAFLGLQLQKERTRHLHRAHSLHWEWHHSYEADNFYEATRVSPKQVSTDCACLMKPSAEGTFLGACTVAPLPVFFTLRWRHRIMWTHLRRWLSLPAAAWCVEHTTWN